MTEVRAPALLGKATYHLHPDDAEAFKAIVGRMAANGSRKPGCLFLHAAQDAEDPTTFYLFEGWDSAESVAAHNASPGFQADLSEGLALRVTGRGGEIYFVSGAQEMPMPS